MEMKRQAYRECKACHGQGERKSYYSDSLVVCTECGGTGEIEYTEVTTTELHAAGSRAELDAQRGRIGDLEAEQTTTYNALIRALGCINMDKSPADHIATLMQHRDMAYSTNANNVRVLESIKRERDELREQVAVLEARLEGATELWQNAQADRDEMVRKVATLEAERAAIKAALISVEGYSTALDMVANVKAALAELEDRWTDALAEVGKVTRERDNWKLTAEQRARILDQVYAERDNALDDAAGLRTQVAQQQAQIGELLALVRGASGDDGPDYARALGVIGAVPPGDVSDPAWGGGLFPLDATKRAESE